MVNNKIFDTSVSDTTRFVLSNFVISFEKITDENTSNTLIYSSHFVLSNKVVNFFFLKYIQQFIFATENETIRFVSIISFAS